MVSMDIDGSRGIILIVHELPSDGGTIEIYNGDGVYMGEVRIDHRGQVQELADAFAAEAEWVVVE